MSSKVLIVEDNADNLKLVSWILEDENIEFEAATTGEQALEMVKSGQFAMVLLDISLPGIDGKETAMRMRAMPGGERLPLVACTAHAIKQEEEAIWASGVNDIITKPIDEGLLLQVVRRYVGP